jgi:hypothetical protein
MESHSAWDATHDEECLTLTCSDDGGALQLSSARKEEGVVTHDDIQWCIANLQGAWSPPCAVDLGDFSGSHVTAEIDGVCWSWWIVGCGPVLLRASYNGPPAAAAVEMPQVLSMLRSLAAT